MIDCTIFTKFDYNNQKSSYHFLDNYYYFLFLHPDHIRPDYYQAEHFYNLKKRDNPLYYILNISSLFDLVV